MPDQDFFQASGYDVRVCSRSAADGRIPWPVLPPSLFFHHFLILANPIPQPFSVCRCHWRRRKMHKKHAPSRSRTATQGFPCGLFTMSAFDCLFTIGAKTGPQRCQVAAWLYMPLAACPVPFSAYMHMLIAIAIVPRHSKARTMSTRRSFRCCKNGLAVFFLTIGTTTIL